MDQQEMAARIKNIDERTERIEQILPTLATKDEIARLATKDEIAQLATKDEIAQLATKDELREAVAPLATKEELWEEGKRTRLHFDIMAEQLRSDIALIAEGHRAWGAQVDALGTELRADIAAHDKRITRLEASKRR